MLRKLSPADHVTQKLKQEYKDMGSAAPPVNKPDALMCWFHMQEVAESIGSVTSTSELSAKVGQLLESLAALKQVKDAVAKVSQYLRSHVQNLQRA